MSATEVSMNGVEKERDPKALTEFLNILSKPNPLRELRTINLNNNHFGSRKSRRKTFFGLISCKNEFAKLHINLLSRIFKHNPALTTLSLSGNSLGTFWNKACNAGIQSCRQLTSLDLRDNGFDHKQILALAKTLEHFKGLQILRLQGNGSYSFLVGLSCCPPKTPKGRVKKLEGWDPTIQASAELFKNLRKLPIQELGLCVLGVKGFKNLACFLSETRTLTSLDVSRTLYTVKPSESKRKAEQEKVQQQARDDEQTILVNSIILARSLEKNTTLSAIHIKGFDLPTLQDALKTHPRLSSITIPYSDTFDHFNYWMTMLKENSRITQLVYCSSLPSEQPISDFEEQLLRNQFHAVQAFYRSILNIDFPASLVSLIEGYAAEFESESVETQALPVSQGTALYLSTGRSTVVNRPRAALGFTPGVTAVTASGSAPRPLVFSGGPSGGTPGAQIRNRQAEVEVLEDATIASNGLPSLDFAVR